MARILTPKWWRTVMANSRKYYYLPDNPDMRPEINKGLERPFGILQTFPPEVEGMEEYKEKEKMMPVYGGRVEYLWLAVFFFFGFTIHNSRNRLEKKLRRTFVTSNKYAPLEGKLKDMSQIPAKF